MDVSYMTIREAAGKLHSEYGRAAWFSACGIGEDQIFLYTTKSSLVARSLEQTGYAGFPVKVVITGKLTS